MSEPEFKPGHQIVITTMYGANVRQPLVSLAWGAERGDLTPDEAHAHALAILECAAASEADAFLIEFLQEKTGADLSAAATILHHFREWREARQGE